MRDSRVKAQPRTGSRRTFSARARSDAYFSSSEMVAGLVAELQAKELIFSNIRGCCWLPRHSYFATYEGLTNRCLAQRTWGFLRVRLRI